MDKLKYIFKLKCLEIFFKKPIVIVRVYERTI